MMRLDWGEPELFRVACLQINASDSVEKTLTRIIELSQEAAERGAHCVVLPENALQMPVSGQSRVVEDWLPSAPTGAVTLQRAMRDLAQTLNTVLIVGSQPIRSAPRAKPTARSYALGRDGEVLALYDKIHLFDVQTQSERGVQDYFESRDFDAGALTQLQHVPGPVFEHPTHPSKARIGLSICYDLRFPEWYRCLLDAGAQIMVVPAAFTAETGEKHWHSLLRARAIENQCFVVAAGQCGPHLRGSATRHTWGHSMVIGPDGEIISTLAHDEGLLIADIDLTSIAKLVNRFPTVRHRRL